ncbi:sodium:proton exchanger [Streptomyces tateyamensis]|uniref:Sodium:proton exchanger n=1 Tax=Streptomyces tateyamensis TaxID=565073 RepID=A0A2V4NC94_9ACTN|nr:cation:proton antiporter [Streptomyces tateyamensis]PYC77707.1 sodium:proton exchanger [Streptomyces tateyamensis]
MTSQQILTGAGLTVVLAVGAQLLAGRLRIPAIIVLLPAGFTAGALTQDVHPDQLLGAAFAPLVSLAVAVILYDAGLGLDLGKLSGHTRRTVVRLVWIGALATAPIAAAAAAPLLGVSAQAATMLGTVLVVSGPTVVGPLLAFVRPNERLQRILLWEGSLIDAVGGILGALVFHALLSDARHGLGSGVLEFLASVALGLAGGALGALLLWWLLVRLAVGEVLGTTAQLAAVIGVAAGCDVLRDDTGLIAAVVMGVAVATVPAFDLPARRPFFESLVSLIVGVLFVSISATVSWSALRPVVLPGLALVAVLVLLARPLVAALATLGTDLGRGERAFLGWMAPRGIVAASTAATFSSELAAGGVGGAEKILPATFLVIVATVTLYGLTATPVARWLGVVRPARSRPLLVGGDPWVVQLALLLRSAGIDVLMWAGRAAHRERIAAAGLELAQGELLAVVGTEGAEQEGITAVFLLTRQEDFNALAASVLREGAELPVYRLAAVHTGEQAVGAGSPDQVLFDPAVAARLAQGAELTSTADGIPADHRLLFTVDPAGRLLPVTGRRPPQGAGLHILLAP